jgi:hypothetical protein|tara:strand:+ start:568 stop:789 length:222 start_codon:yes stop_codon:yes gene_type:complete
MPNNKLKEKVNALTRVIGQMLKDLQEIDNLARGTLTAFQLHIGEEEWTKIMIELKQLEEKELEPEKKLDLDVE